MSAVGKIITLSSAKGGCGKSTLAVLLADYLRAATDKPVALVDCDINGHVLRLSQPADNILRLTGIDARPQGGELDKSYEKIIEAAETHSYVIVDLPGITSSLSFMVWAASDLVLIPAAPSTPDARDAMRTGDALDKMAKATKRNVPYRLVWTKLETGITPRSDTAVMDDARERAFPTLASFLHNRPIFRELFITNMTPRLVDAPSVAVKKAAQEVASIGDEVLALLEGAQNGTAAA